MVTSSINIFLMSPENYLNHPTFGLLFRICFLEEHQELFTTLYAQRVFFLVTTEATGIKFEPVGRSEARLMLENRLRMLRRTGQYQEYDQLQKILQSTFQ
jgi:PII interaction protein X